MGSSCSGKTTLGRQLNEQLQIPCLDIDAVAWKPNWVMDTPENIKAAFLQFMDGKDSWIMSGNYTKVSLELSWPVATHVIWLNYPLRTLVYRYLKRTTTRIITREKVCGDNYESVYNAIFSEDPLLPWILKHHKGYQQKFDYYRQKRFKDKQWLEVTNTSQLHDITGFFYSAQGNGKGI